MIYKAAQIEKYLKHGDTTVKVFVVYGSNEGLAAEYVKKLTATVCPDLYDPFCAVYLNCGDIISDPGLLFSEYTSRSLMGGRRVIVIKDADNNLTKHLKTMLDGPQSDTLVIVSSASLNKKSSLVSLGESRDDMAVIACYEDRDEDVFATVRSLMSENGMTIGNEALQLLCARLSNDRKSNLSEIDKLITYMGDKKNISAEDVRAVIADQSSSNSEDVCYFTAGGYSEKSQAAFQRLLNEGDEPIGVVRSLTYHFNKILTCLAAMEKGETLDKAMFKLVPRIIFYRESSFKRQVSLWSKDRVFAVLELLYKCERDCKTTNMPVNEIVSYTLMQISSAAAKAAAVGGR